MRRKTSRVAVLLGLLAYALVAGEWRAAATAQNEVLGEIEFVGPTKVEKMAGVWVDAQYVGYVKELKGTKKVLLLPGPHEIAVRQAGYKDFVEKIAVQPGYKHTIRVRLERDPQVLLPLATAEVKIEARPARAAVFVDDRFAGHASELGGVGRAMLVVPGKHRIRITLPGYQTFETEIEAHDRQKLVVKTELARQP